MPQDSCIPQRRRRLDHEDWESCDCLSVPSGRTEDYTSLCYSKPLKAHHHDQDPGIIDLFNHDADALR